MRRPARPTIVALLLAAAACQPAARVAARGTIGATGLAGEAGATAAVGAYGLYLGPTVAVNTNLSVAVLGGAELHRAMGPWGVRGGLAAGAHLVGEGYGAELRATVGAVRIVGEGRAVGLELLGAARPIENRVVDWFAGVAATFELGGCWRGPGAMGARRCR